MICEATNDDDDDVCAARGFDNCVRFILFITKKPVSRGWRRFDTAIRQELSERE